MTSWRQKVRDLETENKFLREELEKVNRILKQFLNPHTPSSKKHKKSDKPKEDRFPGKPKGGNGGGLSMPLPDTTVEHTIEECPDCGDQLGESKYAISQKQLDLPPKLAICTEHIINHYYCSGCNKDVAAIHIKGRYGFHLKAYVASLKERGLSCREISAHMKELGFISFSSTTVIAVMVLFASLLEPIRNELLKGLQKEKYIHMDETGFRKDGQNGYIWGFFSKKTSILSAELTRSAKIIKENLGNFVGLGITDGYVGYFGLKFRQRCWAHLLREFKEIAEKHEEIKPLHERAKALYKQLVTFVEIIPTKIQKEKIRYTLNDIVICLESHKVGRKLAKQIRNGKQDWFTAWDYLGAPFQNNLAERGLRRAVMLRKRIGCYRNEVGRRWINICMSVMQTWRMQDANLLYNLKTLAYST
jgi:transposase